VSGNCEKMHSYGSMTATPGTARVPRASLGICRAKGFADGTSAVQGLKPARILWPFDPYFHTFQATISPNSMTARFTMWL
jgi:hypothetical protein